MGEWVGGVVEVAAVRTFSKKQFRTRQPREPAAWYDRIAACNSTPREY